MMVFTVWCTICNITGTTKLWRKTKTPEEIFIWKFVCNVFWLLYPLASSLYFFFSLPRSYSLRLVCACPSGSKACLLVYKAHCNISHEKLSYSHVLVNHNYNEANKIEYLHVSFTLQIIAQIHADNLSTRVRSRLGAPPLLNQSVLMPKHMLSIIHHITPSLPDKGLKTTTTTKKQPDKIYESSVKRPIQISIHQILQL